MSTSGNDRARSRTAPEVSIVVIFLDAERFLQEAIDSVFAQTYDNWELLLVDDGSTDQSGAIVRRAADRDTRIRYLEHPGHENRGRSAARNLGIENARGEFIAFLDADDVWLPRKLERQVPWMRSHLGVGMVYGATQLWQTWSDEASGQNLSPDLGVELGVPLDGATFLAHLLQRQVFVPCASSLLVRTEVARAAGCIETALGQTYDDQAFIAGVCLSAFVLASGECWERHRVKSEGGNPAGSGTDAGGPGTRRAFLEWLDRYLLARGAKERRVHRVLEMERDALRKSGDLEKFESVRRLARTALPESLRRWLRSPRSAGEAVPSAGHVDFGQLRRLTPVSRRWGKDRGGQPIDRYYVERFLAARTSDIHGRVLEVGDDTYARRFGGDAVAGCDILHGVEGNPRATIVADLTRPGDQLPLEAFDCIILTQVLNVIHDPGAAIRALYRALRPGGVVLATVPGISQISRWDMERWGDYWRFTSLSVRRLFESVFPPEDVSVSPHGNVLAATAFLHGLASQDLRSEELDHLDPDYQLLITVRAMKPGTDGTAARPDASFPGKHDSAC